MTRQLSQLNNLLNQGFDQSQIDPDEEHISVRCSQCLALVINGVPAHETGCPNIPKEVDDDDVEEFDPIEIELDGEWDDQEDE